MIASFTTGPGATTLPMRIYSEVRLGVKPEINAICTIMIALVAVVIVIASLASKLTSARGESAAPLVVLRQCEERQRRNNPYFAARSDMDCFRFVSK